MFGKLKQFVGMVGVDVQLELEQQLPLSADSVSGLIRISAKQEQQITKVKATMKQAIHEGTGSERQVRDYYIGEVDVVTTPFTIKPNEILEYKFTLPFSRRRTFDQSMAEQGGILGALGTAGKFMDNEQDNFWVNAVADVKGAALDPSDNKQVWFR